MKPKTIEEYASIYRCPATNENEYCRHDIISAINFGINLEKEKNKMNTYMKKYLVTYWTERNDESTDVELELYAYNEIDAMKKFYDMNLVYRKIESVKELV